MYTYAFKLIIFAYLATVMSLPANAQWLSQFGNSPTNKSVSITTGGTFQNITLPSAKITVTIENNNTNGDNCWIDITGTISSGNTLSTSVTTSNATVAASKAAILLTTGGAFGRYTFTPQGSLVATCTASGDSLYVDTQ